MDKVSILEVRLYLQVVIAGSMPAPKGFADWFSFWGKAVCCAALYFAGNMGEAGAEMGLTPVRMV